MHQLTSQYLLASECASDKYKMFLPPPPFLVKESSPVFLKIILINREIGFLIKILIKLQQKSFDAFQVPLSYLTFPCSAVLGKNCPKLFHFIEKGNKKTDRLQIFWYVDLFCINFLRYFNILQLLLENTEIMGKIGIKTVNPSRPDTGRREKIELNFYSHASLWFLKRFYEVL